MHPWPLAVTLGALLLCAWPPAAALPDITTVDDGDIVMVVEDGHDVRIRHESDASGVSLFDLTGLKDVADNAERSANNYTDEQVRAAPSFSLPKHAPPHACCVELFCLVGEAGGAPARTQQQPRSGCGTVQRSV